MFEEREGRVSEEQIVAQLDRHAKVGCPIPNNTGFDIGAALHDREAGDEMVVSAARSRCGYVITFDANRWSA
jgi:hypothetical protein